MTCQTILFDETQATSNEYPSSSLDKMNSSSSSTTTESTAGDESTTTTTTTTATTTANTTTATTTIGTSANISSDTQLPQSKGKKRVKFHEVIAQVVGYSSTQQHKKKQFWYTHNEIVRFQSIAQKKGNAIRNKGCSALISTAHGLGDHAFLFPKKKQEALNAWVRGDNSNTSSNRGLEVFTNAQYARERQQLRNMITASVMKAQEEEVNLGVDEIAKMSQFYSRASRCFAHRMGKADELDCTLNNIRDIVYVVPTTTTTTTKQEKKRRFSFRGSSKC